VIHKRACWALEEHSRKQGALRKVVHSLNNETNCQIARQLKSEKKKSENGNSENVALHCSPLPSAVFIGTGSELEDSAAVAESGSADLASLASCCTDTMLGLLKFIHLTAGRILATCALVRT